VDVEGGDVGGNVPRTREQPTVPTRPARSGDDTSTTIRVDRKAGTVSRGD
jgi:hypothetical protein